MNRGRSKALEHHALDGLGVLIAVVEAGSFVRAGEVLGLTQSAVSRAVARVEERVGVRLFRRSARSIALTDEGRRFYDSVAPHLAAIAEAATEARGSASQVRGRLRVNVNAGIGQFFLAPQLGSFLERYPEVDVEMVVRDRLGDLVRDGFDVAVRFGLPEPSALKIRLLMRDRIVTCASPDYVARHGKPRRPEDLERHRCLMMRNPATGTAFGWDLVRGKTAVTVAASGPLLVNEVGPLLGACLAGHGVAQLLELYAGELIARGQLVHLLPDWSDETYPLYAYHHAERLQSAKVRAFLSFLDELTAGEQVPR